MSECHVHGGTPVAAACKAASKDVSLPCKSSGSAQGLRPSGLALQGFGDTRDLQDGADADQDVPA